MKIFLLLSVAVLAAGCTTVHRVDSSRFEVIPVPEGIQDPAALQDVAQSITNGVPVIFKIAKGEQMPLKLTVDVPIGHLEAGQNTLVFTRDTYFLISHRGMLLSPDGQRWGSITSPKSLAKVFGYKRGEFSFGFATVSNEPPFMNATLRAK
jgi:hypothetical protein